MRLKHDSEYPAERQKKLESIPGFVKAVFKRNSPLSDDEWWKLLHQFLEREKHANVPLRHKEAGYSLGNWVYKKRASKDSLSQDERLKFENLPGWTWDSREDSFNKGLAMLKVYRDREKHCDVPAEHIENGFNLGKFVSYMRTSFSKGTLDLDKKAQLDEIPGWKFSVIDSQWEAGYIALKQYITREGHSRVPTRHSENGFKLGNWVCRQRTAYRAVPKGISSERIRLLEEIPEWVWDPAKEDFKRKLMLLREYAEREKHAKVPQKHIEQGFALGDFVSDLRESKDRLDPDVVNALGLLPGWSWNAFDDGWNRNCDLLQRFIEDNGHTNVPPGCKVDGVSLGSWFYAQLRKKNLKPDQKERLISLGVMINN
ncbi:MAG: helicase associated domain-containing protein [Verrucomicrobia bacterium]|nr:helicase associated domain-containing protein [Verrucomicrobiota bacterium]